jgi:hypothetical protein
MEQENLSLALALDEVGGPHLFGVVRVGFLLLIFGEILTN